MPRQKARRRLPDLRDAERVDKAVEGDAAALVDRRDQLFGADFAPAFAPDNGVCREPEDIARLIVFLGSRANQQINGQSVLITGGR